MTVNHRQGPGAGDAAQARELLAAATRGVEHLESAAAQASYRLAVLAGVLARREGPATSRAPEAAEAAEAAALGAAGVCRAANALLCYVCSREWRPVRVAANGGSRGLPACSAGPR
jgi:hypothetical protein